MIGPRDFALPLAVGKRLNKGFFADTMTADTIRQIVAITNPAGFHMRPMQAFVETASRFPAANVTVTRDGKPPVNGKSMWGLLGLVAEQGTELVIEVTGPDAAEAMRELLDVMQRNYDEG